MVKYLSAYLILILGIPKIMSREEIWEILFHPNLVIPGPYSSFKIFAGNINISNFVFDIINYHVTIVALISKNY